MPKCFQAFGDNARQSASDAIIGIFSKIIVGAKMCHIESISTIIFNAIYLKMAGRLEEFINISVCAPLTEFSFIVESERATVITECNHNGEVHKAIERLCIITILLQ